MRKHFVVYGAAAGTLFIVSAGFGKQEPGATAVAPNAVTPAPSPPPALIISTPTPPPALLTPTPISPIPSITPPPVDLPSPTPSSATGTMTTERSFLTTSNTFQWSEKGAPVFNLDQAVLTALRQNPDILRAKEEIERTRGVILEIGAQALPHVNPRATLTWTDPNLGRTSAATTFSTSPGVTPGPTVAAAAATATPAPNLTDTAYSIQITGTQLVFNYSTFRSIRATFFQRDSAYFAFRNVVDQVIATVKTQFYQVILNRALIRVQEESVQLLESQLKDQQNRFEAGTVPRFNVLQAQVQLSNQIPNLIAARNNYRISILQLAKTLGLDFNPARGNAAPLRVVGDLVYIPRKISILEAIELGKQSRAFLKQARANVFNAIEQVHVALGGFLPNFTSTGGYEIFSSPFSTSWDDVSKGWVFGVTGNWALWDSGETYGRVKQQRALLSEAKITYDDDVRQVELEIQQAASNLLQNRELIQATEKNVEQADEAVRLAKARLDAGAGTQLDVLNAQVQLTTAQSTRLQALFGYDSSLAEFDRVTGAQSTYTETFSSIAPRATRSRRYYTGSDVDATGKPKAMTGLESVPVTPMSSEPSSK
jgi:outer membrane protein TolC